MKLVIAEKQDQANKLAAPFPTKGSGFGFIEVLPCTTFPKGAYIAWASGHLVSLLDPDDYDPKLKDWKMDYLPILPDHFKMKASKGKERMFNHLKKLLTTPSFTEVINACDPGREGEAIFTYIYQLSGCKKPVKRLWTSSLTKDAVSNAFQNLLPENEKKNLYHEAYARACADWLVGMNTTRAYSILLREKGFKVEKGESFSTGRVQTPVLALIVEREEAINQFISTPFWEVVANLNVNGKTYVGHWFTGDQNRLTDQAKAEKLAAWCNGKPALIEEVNVEEKEVLPPYLFSLSSLQTLANKLFKLSPNEVLQICQKLYDNEYLSYPRTDSNRITEEEAKSFPIIFEKISRLIPYAKFFPTPFQSIIGNKRYVDASKVTDHYAIIPTETVPDLIFLSDNERLIYDLVVKSVIAAHHETAVFQHTKVITYVAEQFSFLTTGKQILREGWRKVMQTEDPDDKNDESPMLPPLTQGESGHVASCTAKEGWTSPPKRFTQGDLIPMMKSAGNKLGDKELESIMRQTNGLGTEATRASIIQRLMDQRYIEVKKNLVYTTEKGRTLIRAIGFSALSSPETTGKWEQKLKEIGEGRFTAISFIDHAKKLTTKLVADAIDSVRTMDTVQAIPLVKEPVPSIAKPTSTVSTNQEVVAASDSARSNTLQDDTSRYPATTDPSLTADKISESNSDPYIAAVQTVIDSKHASVSLLTRRLRKGYTECAQYIDRMEKEGVIGPYLGSTPREVLMTMQEFVCQYDQAAKEEKTTTTEVAALPPTSGAAPAQQLPDHETLRPVDGPESEYTGPSTKPQAEQSVRQIPAEQDIGPCKKCGQPVIDKGVLYGCSSYHDTGCDFTISKTIKGVQIERTFVENLLKRGSSGLIRGFIQKSKDANKPESTFDAILQFNKEGKLCWRSPSIEVFKVPTSLLRSSPIAPPSFHEQKKQFSEIEREAANLKLPSKVMRATHGPRVTRYELEPQPGINITNFKRYKANFQLALKAESISIYVPIPGKSVVGIEVPNKTPYTVYLRSLLENKEYLASKKTLMVPMGMDMSGEPVLGDISDMPHLLVAGQTGSGKSVFLNSTITGLLFGHSPDQLKFVFIDPKKVELSVYDNIPHLFGPIVTDVRRAMLVLKKLVVEMEKRYDILQKYGVRNIQTYHERILPNQPSAPSMPYIILVIDELADLMMTTGPDVEDAIQRLAQLARAAGIHMIIATQRPSKQVISPIIKANLPVRVAFKVSSHFDSQVILDEPGAEDLLGNGDMFYLPKDGVKRRMVSAYVSDEEIERVVEHLNKQYPNYNR